MKILSGVILFLIIFPTELISQRYDYWKNASAEGSKIYSILFLDGQKGYAVSSDGGIFASIDSGNTWIIKSDNSSSCINESKEIFWSADIYCSAMQTTDSGLTWHSYSKEKQDHFCQVYLKDENTGYKIAGEFLNTVVSRIFTSLSNNEMVSLINYPQQCTEYYSNANEGWALGWCLKNFKRKNNQ